MNILIYDESRSMLEETSKSSSSSWNSVHVPSGFHVIDTVIPNKITGSSVINGIQITRFATPFLLPNIKPLILVLPRARHYWTSFGVSFPIISK